MAKTSVDKIMAQFVKTSSARANSTTEQTTRPPVRRIKVKSSSRPPVKMKLSVHYRASKDQPIILDPEKPGAIKPAVSDLLSGLDARDEEFLRKIEPELLKWLSKSKKNAARFYANPVATLDKAGIKVPAKLLQKIKRIRRNSVLDRPALPTADLTKVKFKK